MTAKMNELLKHWLMKSQFFFVQEVADVSNVKSKFSAEGRHV